HGQSQTGLDVRLGGEPATISGQVVGADPSGATITLELPDPGPAAGAPPAVVMTETLDAAGIFSLTQIPSPGTYQLVVSKQGYATQTQQIDLGGGEQRKGVIITLRQGNGSISGQVSSASGPLGGATISASDGHTTVSTVSVTQGPVGSFTLTNL